MKDKKSVAFYIRVSSEESAEKGYSVKGQIEKLEDFADKNNYQIAEKHYFADEGISGAKGADERPALKSLMDSARDKEFDLVLVYRLDRLFRKTRLLLETAEELSNYDVAIRSITEPFDTSNSMGRFMLTSLGSIAELERETILERMELGRVRAVKDGVWIGGIPFGFKKNPETKRLEIFEEEADVVRKMYVWFLEGGSVHYVQKRLNENKIPTRYDREGREKKTEARNWWRRRTVHRMMTNPIYAGRYEFRRKKIPQRSDYKENFNHPDDIIVQEVPKIIEEEVFYEVQRLIKKGKEDSKRNTKKPYLFNRLIRCGDCGQKWGCQTRTAKLQTGENSVKKYYFCYSTRNGLTPYDCQQRQLREECFDNAVWPKLTELLTRPEIVYKEIEDRLKDQTNIESLKRELNEQKRGARGQSEKLKRLNELYIEGAIEKSVYQEKKESIEKEHSAHKKRIKKLERQLEALPSLSDFKKSVKRVYDRYLDSLSELSYKARGFVIHKLVEEIEFANGYANMTVLLPSCRLDEEERVY